MKPIPSRIKEARTRLNRKKWERKPGESCLTLAKVADETGISEQELADFETGQAEPSDIDIDILSIYYYQDWEFFAGDDKSIRRCTAGRNSDTPGP